MKKDTILKRAEFSPKVKTYWILSGLAVSLLTVVGIPLIIIWLPLTLALCGRYLASMECILKPRELIIRKGILNRVEKTIPLEKITDLGLQQGPIMRVLGLHTLSVETAGQSGSGALVSLTGIVDVEAFREAVLEQRDRVSEREPAASVPSDAGGDEAGTVLLAEIRDALLRIEKKLPASRD